VPTAEPWIVLLRGGARQADHHRPRRPRHQRHCSDRGRSLESRAWSLLHLGRGADLLHFGRIHHGHRGACSRDGSRALRVTDRTPRTCTPAARSRLSNGSNVADVGSGRARFRSRPPGPRLRRLRRPGSRRTAATSSAPVATTSPARSSAPRASRPRPPSPVRAATRRSPATSRSRRSSSTRGPCATASSSAATPPRRSATPPSASASSGARGRHRG